MSTSDQHSPRTTPLWVVLACWKAPTVGRVKGRFQVVHDDTKDTARECGSHVLVN